MSQTPDTSVYPDRDPPAELITLEQKADYLHRVLAAFDHGIPPTEPTLRIFRDWQEVFDCFPLSGSPAYHALRAYFGWSEVPRTRFFGAPAYQLFDRLEGREDGFEDRV